jgi:hypothetical protein
VRARIVRSALNPRALFKNIHRRTHALNEALARFHARKGRIGTGAGVDVEALAGWLQCDRT